VGNAETTSRASWRSLSYPPAIFPPFIAAYTRFLKAASLARALRLTADELSPSANDADHLIAVVTVG